MTCSQGYYSHAIQNSNERASKKLKNDGVHVT